jgi:uncharacterized protein
MTIFVDTSALLTVLDADEERHQPAERIWNNLLDGDQDLVCTNYVLVETIALAQHRLGVASVATLNQDIFPALKVIWVDEGAHQVAVSALLAAARRQLSLVDCSSFDAMRRLGIRQAFTFDKHFAEQGFECLPGDRQDQRGE